MMRLQALCEGWWCIAVLDWHCRLLAWRLLLAQYVHLKLRHRDDLTVWVTLHCVALKAGCMIA